MESEKTLVLEFWDEDNKTKSLIIKNPKDDLTKEQVVEAMQTIIDADVLLTSASKHLVDVANCYYRTVTKEVLVSDQPVE